MTKAIVCFLFVGVLFFGCKKKESTPTETPSNTGVGGTNTGNQNSNGSGTTNYDALFEVMVLTSKYNGNFLPGSTTCRAMLCAQTVTNEVLINFLNIGNVSLNNVTFANHLSTIYYYYVDSTYTSFSAPYTWSVTGSSSFTAAAFTNTTSFPSFPNYTTIPDSISKAAGFSISLNGLTGCDFIQAQINGPSGSQYSAPKIIAGNAYAIAYSPSELTGMNTGSTGYLSLKFFKDNVQLINGKKINIRSAIGYSVINFKIKN